VALVVQKNKTLGVLGGSKKSWCPLVVQKKPLI
jgi:hypothetical protein